MRPTRSGSAVPAKRRYGKPSLQRATGSVSATLSPALDRSSPLTSVCVIPAMNEGGKIGALVGRFGADVVDQVVVVDDGSRDATAEESRAAGARVIQHRRNRGVGAAIRTGIDYALEQ